MKSTARTGVTPTPDGINGHVSRSKGSLQDVAYRMSFDLNRDGLSDGS